MSATLPGCEYVTKSVKASSTTSAINGRPLTSTHRVSRYPQRDVEGVEVGNELAPDA